MLVCHVLGKRQHLLSGLSCRRRWLQSNHADADVGIKPEAAGVLVANFAAALDVHVEQDAVRLGDGFAEISLLDLVEAIAVVNGAIHVGSRRYHAAARGSG